MYRSWYRECPESVSNSILKILKDNADHWTHLQDSGISMTDYEMMRFKEMLPEFYGKMGDERTESIEKLFDSMIALETALQTPEFYKEFIIHNRHIRTQGLLDESKQQYRDILKEVDYFIENEEDGEWAQRIIMIMNDSMLINWEKEV